MDRSSETKGVWLAPEESGISVKIKTDGEELSITPGRKEFEKKHRTGAKKE